MIRYYSHQQVRELTAASSLGGWFTTENTIRPMRFHSELQRMTIEHVMNGHIYTTVLSIGSHAQLLPEECFESLVKHMSITPVPAIIKASVRFVVLGGAAVNTDRGTKTCVPISVRHSRYFALIETQWRPETGEIGKQEARKWTKLTFDLLVPYRSGVIKHAPDAMQAADAINVDGSVDSADDGAFNSFIGVSTSFKSSEKIADLDAILKQRLREIKHKYDPVNRFRNNANILPFKSSSTDCV